MKLGVFGGSFNPPHYAHFEIAKRLIEQGIVEKVAFVPVGDFYKKNDLIHSSHRLAMLKMYADQEKQIEISELELHKERQNYMFETLDELKSLDPTVEISLVIGSDNLLDLLNWKRYAYLIQNYSIIVISRNDLDDLKYIEQNFPAYAKQFVIVQNPFEADISSKKIRQLIREQQRVDSYLLKEVYDYILKNK